MAEEKNHDFALWFLIQSGVVCATLVLLLAVLIIRGDWNAGWVACANNHDVVKVQGRDENAKPK